MKSTEEINNELAILKLKLAKTNSNDSESLQKIQKQIKTLELKKQISILKKRILDMIN